MDAANDRDLQIREQAPGPKQATTRASLQSAVSTWPPAATSAARRHGPCRSSLRSLPARKRAAPRAACATAPHNPRPPRGPPPDTRALAAPPPAAHTTHPLARSSLLPRLGRRPCSPCPRATVTYEGRARVSRRRRRHHHHSLALAAAQSAAAAARWRHLAAAGPPGEPAHGNGCLRVWRACWRCAVPCLARTRACSNAYTSYVC